MKMDTKTLLLLGGVGLVAYVLYQRSQTTTASTLQQPDQNNTQLIQLINWPSGTDQFRAWVNTLDAASVARVYDMVFNYFTKAIAPPIDLYNWWVTNVWNKGLPFLK
jgi:hypothetical protein